MDVSRVISTLQGYFCLEGYSNSVLTLYAFILAPLLNLFKLWALVLGA